jgi:hypothetical protein
VSGQDDAHADLLRKFQAAISGMDLADLRQLAGEQTRIGGKVARRAARPELRRPPFDELKILRIRVDLGHAEPPIWRRLDLRSDLTLDVVHQVLQVAFDWTDSHLHRFSLGGHPFDRTSQLFLCPYDVEEGELDDEGGIPASEVRLDETLQKPSDVLAYLYDYGDSWELTMRLEEVLPASPDAPSAAAVAGRRAAPPEDSGGGTDLASIALVVDDPAHFDLDALNQALRGPYSVLREYGVDQRLVDLVNRLRYTSIGEDLAARTLTLASEPTRPSDDELAAALRAYVWFLNRAEGGIELTSAGYLKPADVEAASLVVPAVGDWIGKNNRESHAAPLLHFRQSLQSMGLLRKYKGSLLLTRAGASAERDPRRLWDLLAGKLIPVRDGFETEATLLLLAYAASSADTEVPLKPIAEALAHLGWWHGDGRPPGGYELYRLPAFNILINVSDKSAELGGRRRISPAAAALARAALRRCSDPADPLTPKPHDPARLHGRQGKRRAGPGTSDR